MQSFLSSCPNGLLVPWSLELYYTTHKFSYLFISCPFVLYYVPFLWPSFYKHIIPWSCFTWIPVLLYYLTSHSGCILSSSSLFFASHNNTFSDCILLFHHSYCLYPTMFIVPNFLCFQFSNPSYLISLFIPCRILSPSFWIHIYKQSQSPCPLAIP